MYCPACRAEVAATMRICPDCGGRELVAALPALEPAPAKPPAPAQASVPVAAPAPKRREPERGGIVMYLAMVFWTGVFFLGWTVAFAFLQPFIGPGWATWIMIFALIFTWEGALESYEKRAPVFRFALRILLTAWFGFLGVNAMMRNEALERLGH